MPGLNIKRNQPIPPWPDLNARQKREALAATWLPRLIESLAGAAVLAGLASFASYEAMDALGWRAALSAALAAGFFAAFLYVRGKSEPGPWIAPAGLATLTVTQLNLVNCAIEYLNGGQHALGTPEAAYVIVALAAGTLWALRIHLSLEAFVWAAGITAAILWLPWLSLVEAPLEFCLMGAATIAVGAQMRAVSAERAYDAYRRETLWPSLWRKRLDLAVTRELAALGAAVANSPWKTAVEDREETSVLSLAMALAPSADTGRAGALDARMADSRA